MSIQLNDSNEEKLGYRTLISSTVINLLGWLYTSKQQNFINPDNPNEILVKKAKLLFKSKLMECFDQKSISEELEVGYSWFRKVFKESTGHSPGQYFIQLKIDKAKELLAFPQHSIKEVSYMLKFDSPYYFSNLFKQKTGVRPLEYRNSVTNHN